jgi:tRNA(Leu) C34 or U34 (ribose-2'-O)-methylase TrmL
MSYERDEALRQQEGVDEMIRMRDRSLVPVRELPFAAVADRGREPQNRGMACVGLWQPKSDSNVGSVLRASQAFGANMVAVCGSRYRRAATDTTKAYRHIPTLTVDDLFAVIPFACVPVAVDILDGAHELPTYAHPESAFYIFGPEDGTLGRAITDRCRDKLLIPTAFCLNLAAAVNVVLYDRLAKQRRRAR